VVLGGAVVGGAAWLATGCSGWSPTEPFTRNSPEVDRAIGHLDAGDFPSAEQVLADYLGTGRCGDAGLGLPPKVRERPSGSFDLGLTLFYLAEKYGRRFGEEEVADAGPGQPEKQAERALEIECALIVAQAIANDPDAPIELRARAFYLAGNLEFMRQAYEEAVANYDKALQLVPGVPEEAGSDGIGRDAAWNRAIALRRLAAEDAGPPDAGPDAPPDAPPDAQPDSGDDGGDDGGEPDAGQDGGDDGGQPDAGNDGGPDDAGPDGGEDGGKQDDGGKPDQPDQPEDQAEPRPPERSRMLEDLRDAPTYQEEQAKQEALRQRRRRDMEDK
jgi:hypothetical protein